MITAQVGSSQSSLPNYLLYVSKKKVYKVRKVDRDLLEHKIVFEWKRSVLDLLRPEHTHIINEHTFLQGTQNKPNHNINRIHTITPHSRTQ